MRQQRLTFAVWNVIEDATSAYSVGGFGDDIGLDRRLCARKITAAIPALINSSKGA